MKLIPKCLNNSGNTFGKLSPKLLTIYTDNEGKYFTEDSDKNRIYVNPMNTSISDDPSEWTYTDDNGNQYTPHRTIDTGEITQGYAPTALDRLYQYSNKHYQDPILGAAARFADDWHNDKSPVKAGISYFDPTGLGEYAIDKGIDLYQKGTDAIGGEDVAMAGLMMLPFAGKGFRKASTFMGKLPKDTTKWLGNKTKNFGEYIFDHLPYKQINLLDRTTDNAVSFMQSNPLEFNLWRKEQLIKRTRRNPQFMIDKLEDITLPSSITVNSKKDGMDLLKSRYKWRYDNSNKELYGYSGKGRFLDYDPSYGVFTLDETPQYESNLAEIEINKYLSPKQVYKMVKNDGDYNPILAAIFTIPNYFSLNYNPGFATLLNGGKRMVKINPSHLKSRGYDLSNTLAHEVNHALDTSHKFILNNGEQFYPDGFKYSHLSKGILKYFRNNGNTELKARGTQIKNYFGLEGGEEITPDMLKYAAKHYVKDTGMDNNMTQFFSGITDWNKVAKWLSKNALSGLGVTVGLGTASALGENN